MSGTFLELSRHLVPNVACILSLCRFSSIATRTLARPFIMLYQEPILWLVTIYLSVIYGLLYALFSVFPIIWGTVSEF